MQLKRIVPWLPFLVVAMALVAGVLGAALISPLYPFYVAAWGLSHGAITLIYVVYMMGVLSAFLFFSRLSDSWGPVRVLRLSLSLCLGGLLLSAVAPDLPVLMVARVLFGVGAGMTSTAATMGLFLLEPAGAARRAPLITSVVTMAGFGAGPLLGGMVAQFLPYPLVAPFLVVAVLVVLTLCGLARVNAQGGPASGRSLSLRPQLGVPVAGVRIAFFVAGVAVFIAYAMFSLLAALAPSFMERLLPWHGPLVSGAAIAVVLFFSSAVQLPARRMPPHLGLRLGFGGVALGSLVLALSVQWDIGWCFFAALVVVGLGHGLSFMSGLAMVNRLAPREKLSSLLATFFSVGYLGTIVPILLVGYLADAIGLNPAVVAFCLFFALAALALLLLTGAPMHPERVARVLARGTPRAPNCSTPSEA